MKKTLKILFWVSLWCFIYFNFCLFTFTLTFVGFGDFIFQCNFCWFWRLFIFQCDVWFTLGFVGFGDFSFLVTLQSPWITYNGHESRITRFKSDSNESWCDSRHKTYINRYVSCKVIFETNRDTYRTIRTILTTMITSFEAMVTMFMTMALSRRP